MAIAPLHSAIGIGITRLIPEPVTAISLSFLSHFFMDLYPEWYDQDLKYDSKEKTMFVIESLLGLGVIAFLCFHDWVFWASAVAANIPDIWEVVYKKVKKNWTNRFWFCHGGGYFPFKVSVWQGFGMRAIQTAVLDSVLVTVILLLSR